MEVISGKMYTLTDQWVAVADRLPEKTCNVLAYDGAGVFSCGFMTGGGSLPRFYGGDGDAEYVTHWMPLPSPPAE
jgi:hypothetical protein